MHHRYVPACLIGMLTLALFLADSIPAEAQSRTRSWEDYYRSYMDSDRTSSRTSTRSGYSSATQRAINDLDDDEVEKLPIPILFGLTLGRIYSDFGDPRDGGDREHEGQDLLAPRGTPIASPTDAVVTRTGTGSSSGIYVYTANPGGESFRYMHLDEIAEGVKAGKVLKVGDIIGFVGDTGNAKGGVTHLHFEIRDGREALDPYPRLAREFTLKERVASVADYIDELDNDEAEEFAEAMVASYRAQFVQARLGGVELPEEIDELLGEATATVASGVVRALEQGMEGSDVTALQVALVALDKGPAAHALAGAGTTGYFGALTKAALIEYQLAASISPAAGYYGPLTRAKMAAEAK